MKRYKLLLIFTVFALVLVGCSSDKESNGGNVQPVVVDEAFNILMNAQPTGFNPLTTNDSKSSNINVQIYETLYERTGDGTSYVPLLAEDMPTISEDQLSATIKLKEGIKFTNGDPFNAEAVKFTIERIKDKEYGSARASIAASIVDVEIVNDYEVKLNLSYPDGVLVAKLAHMNSAMISPTSDGLALMTEPVGTGPYKMTSSIAGSEYTLEYNEEYWGEEPEIKKVVFTVVAETSTAISRLETGEADFMPEVPVTNVNRVKQIPNVTFQTSPSSKITYMGLRSDAKAKNDTVMSNPEARKAMLMAIDREAYVATLEGNAQGLNSILPTTVFGYKTEADNYGYTYNPEEAKKIIEAEGIKDEPITILTSTEAEKQIIAEFIQSSLKSAGFTNVELLPQEFATYLATAKLPDQFDLVILTWANVTGDGTEFFDPNVHSVNSSQRVGYTNPAFDKLVDESRETMDVAVRLEKLDGANKLSLEDAVVTPLYNSFNTFAFSNNYADVTILPGTYFTVADYKFAK